MRKDAIFAIFLASLSLSSCGQSDPVQVESFSGEVPHSTLSSDGSWAALLVDTKAPKLYITMWGSSSCPWIATGVDHNPPVVEHIRITTQQSLSDSGICSADINAHTSEITLDPDIALADQITVSLESFSGSITLAPQKEQKMETESR